MNDVLFQYNPWWEDADWHAGYQQRHDLEVLYEHLGHKQIIFLTGLRRIGKTSLMKLCIDRLIHTDSVSPKHIFYISLDDFRLGEMSILDIVDAFRAAHKLGHEVAVYLFLDEVTFKAQYAQQLKNLYDREHAKIVASSSSASLLKDRQALLTGRSVVQEVMPLSFVEYLDFKSIIIKKADSHLVDVHFREFLLTGGIPEYVLSENDAYIRELMDNIIYKDIAAIHGIKQLSVLKDYFLLLMERSGKTMSINKVAKVLGISSETSKRYFDHFCDTYIVHPVERFGTLNERLVSPKKIYACDTGIRSYYTGARDWGALFENYAYLRLRHLRPRYIYESATEIDFYLENGHLLECKYHDEALSPKQQALFDTFDAKVRGVIRSPVDLEAVVKAYR